MTAYRYHRKFFAPSGSGAVGKAIGMKGGDHPIEAMQRPYVHTDDIILAVNIAMAAKRPLLVAGSPGSGKSSLAANIARHGKGWSYTQKVITARTEARDLLWRFDAVARLRDAHVPGDMKPLPEYVHKGVLWEAFEASARGERMVVLIDEIDKADPDLPNSLLETLGTGSFPVDDLPGKVVTASRETPPFIVITTNNERDLSRPFVRRCVTLTLPPPDAKRLLEIAASWGLTTDDRRGVAPALATEIEALAASSREFDATPSAAEYLDAVRTCLALKIGPGDAEWDAVRRATLTKSTGSQAPVASGATARNKR
jgi:MoxR-like ATPase